MKVKMKIIQPQATSVLKRTKSNYGNEKYIKSNRQTKTYTLMHQMVMKEF